MDVQHAGVTWRRTEQGDIWWWDGQQWIAYDPTKGHPQPPPQAIGRAPGPPPSLPISTGGPPKSQLSRPVAIAAIAVSALVLLGVCGSMLSGPETETDTPTSSDQPEPDEEKAPAEEAKFKAKVIAFEAQNPASLLVLVETRNVGEVTARPSCTVRGRDPSYTYSGFDFFDLREKLRPGDVQRWNGSITIENEGAGYVTKVTVKCEAA